MLQVRFYASYIRVLHQFDFHGRRCAHSLLQYIGRFWLILVGLVLSTMQSLTMLVHVCAAEERHRAVGTGVQHLAGVCGCVLLEVERRRLHYSINKITLINLLGLPSVLVVA